MMPKHKSLLTPSAGNGKHWICGMNAALGCEHRSKVVIAVCAALVPWLAGSSNRFEACAEERPSFARALKFDFPSPKNYHSVSLYVSDGQIPKAKSSSWRDAQKWSCREEKQGWLLYTSVEADAEIPPGLQRREHKRMYLAYRMAHPEKATEKSDVPLVLMSETVEPNCYWTFERGDRFTKTRLRFHARASSGDFKGFYLDLGSEEEDKIWSVTIFREKPAKPNSMWLEAP